MRALRIRLDKEFLSSVIGFPEDVEIWDARIRDVEEIELLIRSDRFKSWKPGDVIPYAAPEISVRYDEHGNQEDIEWIWPVQYLEESRDGISGIGPGESGGDLSDIEQGGSNSPGEDA